MEDKKYAITVKDLKISYRTIKKFSIGIVIAPRMIFDETSFSFIFFYNSHII